MVRTRAEEIRETVLDNHTSGIFPDGSQGKYDFFISA
jgi:hypothetical protein